MIASDLHLGHKNVTMFRTQFKDVDEHDEFVFNSLIESLNPSDHLWLLGDICFKESSLHYVRRLAEHVNTLNLVLGNHDTDKGSRGAAGRAVMDIADNVYGLVKKSRQFWFSHAPIHPQELRGCVNVHGHVHSDTIDDKNYVNVSLENTGYKAIDFQDIKAGWRGVPGVVLKRRGDA